MGDNPKAGSEIRIADMCNGIWSLLNYWLPGVVILEWCTGKVGRRHGTGGGAGLAVYGASCGALWREVCAWLRYQPPEKELITKIILINENTWTRGINKRDRQIAIADLFPGYRIEQDGGADLADAIGLAVFYQREKTVRLAECLK